MVSEAVFRGFEVASGSGTSSSIAGEALVESVVEELSPTPGGSSE